MSENAPNPSNFAFEGQFTQSATPTSDSGGVGFIPSIPNPTVLPSAEGGLTYLEQMAANTCKNTPYMVGKNETSRCAVLFRPRCKLWSCPDCRKTNSDLWCLRATLGAESLLAQSGQLHLVTVTAHERLTLPQAIAVLPDGWPMLRKRWYRESGKPQYMLVPEIGKRSRHFHIHLITNLSPGTRWWKDNARSCGFGYQADDSDTFDGASRAGYYVGKYLYKQFERDVFRKGFHRVRTSHGWPKLPPLERDPSWAFSVLPKLQSLQSVVEQLQADGYHIALADHKSAWSVVNSV